MIALATVPSFAQGWTFLNVGDPLADPVYHRREIFDGVVGIGPFAPKPALEPVRLLHLHSTMPGNVAETPYFPAYLRLQTESQNYEGDNKYHLGETGIEFLSGSTIHGGASWCVGKILGVSSGQGINATGTPVYRSNLGASIDLRGGLAFYCSPSYQTSLPNEAAQIEVMRIVDSKVGIGTIYPQAQLHATKQIMTGETNFSTYDAARRGILSFMPGSNGIQYHIDNRDGIFHISHGSAPGGSIIYGSGSGDGDIMDILGWSKSVSIGATFSGGVYMRTFPSATSCSFSPAVGGAKLTVSDEPVILQDIGNNNYLDVRPIILRLERRNVVSGDNITAPYKLISAGDGSAESFVVLSGGNVGIGTSSPSSLLDIKAPTTSTRLAVFRVLNSTGTEQFKISHDGYVLAQEVKIALQSSTTDWAWPDYVFKKDYRLLPLCEVEQYINNNGHLPGIPSAKEINTEKGFEVGSMQVKLLEKIEEMTLHLIRLEKELESTKQQLNQQTKGEGK